MAMTVNRQPYSVSTSISNKDNFFTHASWKGMSDDKNFLTSDQETFESCRNVYVDSEGLLRSRPSLKLVPNSLKIVDIWTFGNIVLVLSKTDDSRYDLYVTNIDEKINASTLNTDYYYINDKLKPIQIEDKIFLLSPDSLRYINTKNLDIGNAEQFIYVPETKVYTSLDEGKEAESKNALTGNEVLSYVYTSELNTEFMVGKDLYFTMLDKTYEVKFSSLTPLTFIDRLPILAPDEDYIVCTFAREGYDSIAIACKNTRQFLYSADGNSWTFSSSIPGKDLIEDLKFTQDGNEVYCKERVPNEDPNLITYKYYMISVTKTENNDGVLNYRLSSFIFYHTSNGFPTSVSGERAYFVDWKTGVSISYTENDKKPQIMVFKESGAKQMPIDKITIQTDGNLWMFRNFHKGLPVVFFSQGYTGRLSYIVLTDSYDFNFNGSIGLPSSGSQSLTFPDNLTRVGENLIFTSWSYDVLEQFVIGPLFSAEVRNLYSVPRSTELAVNHDASVLMTPTAFCKDGKITGHLETPLRIFGAGNYFYALYNIEGADKRYIYSNKVDKMFLKEKIIGENSKLQEFLTSIFDGNPNYAQLEETYISAYDKLYISSKRYDESNNVLLYFPEINVQTFTSKITGLQPISSEEMAIFMNDEVWYSKITESGYYYSKSKLQVGLKDGADVITSYDGTQVIFSSKRGLVSLSYQNFVASTDQSLTFLSDSIHSHFISFSENPVKLLRYQYWLICYSNKSKYGYVYDIRNKSWWPIDIFVEPIKVLDVGNKIIVFSNDLYELDKSDENYFDFDGRIEYNVDWFVKSQKLHFNAINYNKHIANITVLSVLDSNNSMSFKMKINNYRKKIDETEIQSREYKVDAIRTYVQRVSFPKVNEFQYTLISDDEQSIRVPLSLSGITIKYRIGSQVR